MGAKSLDTPRCQTKRLDSRAVIGRCYSSDRSQAWIRVGRRNAQTPTWIRFAHRIALCAAATLPLQVACNDTRPVPGETSSVDLASNEGSATGDAASTPDFASSDMAPCNSFLDTGYCFQHTIPCQKDADCPTPYFGCFPSIGGQYCRTWQSLGCLYGSPDCPGSQTCIKNERAGGACYPIKSTCATAANCPSGERCLNGRCAEPCCAG